MVRQKITMLKKIVVVSPHPDDETLGCGATLLKLKDQGSQIHWLNVTNMKKEYGFAPARVSQRQKEIAMVKQAYRFDDFIDLGLEPAGLDVYPCKSLVEKIVKVFADIEPDSVFLPFCDDAHSDHRVVFAAAYNCIKSFRFPSVAKVLMYETLSETDFAPAINGRVFVPQVFSDITEQLEKKIKIMKIYKSEIHPHPFPRSEENIRALATLRGSVLGAKYAEAFMVLKDRI